MQCVLQLFAEPADSHFHPDRADQFAQQLLPEVRAGRFFFLQFCDFSTPLDESFAGLITRTNTLAFNGTGTAAANRISDVLDLEATLHLTQHLRLIEKFYFWAYRIPENGNFTELDYSCAVPPCTLLSTPLTTPTHSRGRPP